MNKLRWWIISFAVILMYALYSGHSRASENEPIREPVYESPRVYPDSNGKVVFKEFFDGLTINRIEFYDSDSGELLYGVSLQDGRLVGKKEGSLVGENDSSFDESDEIVKYKYFSNNGKTLMRTYEYIGELLRYSVIVGEASRPLALSIGLKQGSVKRATREFRLNNEKVHFKRDLESGTYEEIYIHNNGSDTHRIYKSGFLERERHTIPGEGGGYIVPYIAYYLQGRLAFTTKMKWKHYFKGESKKWYFEEITVYDEHNKLVSKANKVIGESISLKEEVVDGRKALQVIHHGQDGLKKVEAVRFEDE